LGTENFFSSDFTECYKITDVALGRAEDKVPGAMRSSFAATLR